ncbi:6014_t:CDS:2, partial [Gigaspora rosea]
GLAQLWVIDSVFVNELVSIGDVSADGGSELVLLSSLAVVGVVDSSFASELG